jgi:hypothetical protein
MVIRIRIPWVGEGVVYVGYRPTVHRITGVELWHRATGRIANASVMVSPMDPPHRRGREVRWYLGPESTEE